MWLFDLDDTLHDAHNATMGDLRVAMARYIEDHLQLAPDEAQALRSLYWQRYGATLLGLMKHHGVRPAHFLHHTHLLPGLEQRVRAHGPDIAALARLPGRRFVLTNAPAAYAARVMHALGLHRHVDGVLSIEDMHMFGTLRPKPDARMLRRVAARLKVPPHRCTLVEDTLEHQKSARRIGMQTVWMQRWLPALQAGGRRPLRPAYVGRRVLHLRQLLHDLAM